MQVEAQFTLAGASCDLISMGQLIVSLCTFPYNKHSCLLILFTRCLHALCTAWFGEWRNSSQSWWQWISWSDPLLSRQSNFCNLGSTGQIYRGKIWNKNYRAELQGSVSYCYCRIKASPTKSRAELEVNTYIILWSQMFCFSWHHNWVLAIML